MKTQTSPRPGKTGAFLWSLACILGWAAASHAADGSGFATAVPNTVQSGSSGNDFTLQYTATEDMGDGSVRMTVPNGFPDPNANNTTVTVVDGISADVLDDLEATPLLTGTPGWNADDGLPIVNIVSVASDAGEFHEGARSLEVNFLANLGLFTPSVWYNFDAARNWAGYTHFSFRIKLSTVLSGTLDLGDGELRISENADLGAPTIYDLENSQIDTMLLEDGEWAQVTVDLTSAPPASRDAVLSYGIKFPSLSLGVATSLNLDYFLLGPGSPIFSGPTATQHLISLDDGGTVTFQYDGVTAPAQTGTYVVEFLSRSDAGGTLTPIGDSPEIRVVDIDTQDCRGTDADADGGTEVACDTDGDGCFGDAYFDPDGSSVACINVDGNNDGCPDFFIDVDGTGCAQECPDVFWDPTQEVLNGIDERDLDVNGDGSADQVCAYDSDGDGDDDSFVQPDPENPNDGGIGGVGGGQPNPFFEGSGCSLHPDRGAAPARLNLTILSILTGLGMAGLWRGRIIQRNA